MGAGKGNLAETWACQYLQAQGLTLLERNYHCRRGEIDLIMRDKEHIVFVEVRLRSNPAFGSGAESIDHRKRTRLVATAQHYLQSHDSARRCACRFDVISIANGNSRRDIHWIRDAFEAL